METLSVILFTVPSVLIIVSCLIYYYNVIKPVRREQDKRFKKLTDDIRIL